MIRYVDFSHQSEWKLGLLLSSLDKTWSVAGRHCCTNNNTATLLPYTVERCQTSVPESSYDQIIQPMLSDVCVSRD